MVQIRRYVNRLLDSTSWILSFKEEAYLIDCGDFIDIYNKFPYSFRGVFLTHTHVDHIYGLKSFLEKFPQAIVHTSNFGRDALFCPKQNLSKYFNIELGLYKNLFLPHILHEGDSICLFDGHLLNVYETPGHDKSCLTFQLDNYLFTGDSYIPGQKIIVGFPNSNKYDAALSEVRIRNLARGKFVCPGHGDMMKF